MNSTKNGRGCKLEVCTKQYLVLHFILIVSTINKRIKIKEGCMDHWLRITKVENLFRVLQLKNLKKYVYNFLSLKILETIVIESTLLNLLNRCQLQTLIKTL